MDIGNRLNAPCAVKIDLNSIADSSWFVFDPSSDDIRKKYYVAVAARLENYRTFLCTLLNQVRQYLSRTCVSISDTDVKDFLNYILKDGVHPIPLGESESTNYSIKDHRVKGFIKIRSPVFASGMPEPRASMVPVRYHETDTIGYQHIFCTAPGTGSSSKTSRNSSLCGSPVGSPSSKRTKCSTNTAVINVFENDDSSTSVGTVPDPTAEAFFKKVCQKLCDWPKSEILVQHVNVNSTFVRTETAPMCMFLVHFTDQSDRMHDYCLKLAHHIGIIYIDHVLAKDVEKSIELINQDLGIIIERLMWSEKSKSHRYLRKLLNDQLTIGKSNFVITRNSIIYGAMDAQFKTEVSCLTDFSAPNMEYDAEIRYKRTPDSFVELLSVISVILERGLGNVDAHIDGHYIVNDEKTVKVAIPVLAIIPLYCFQRYLEVRIT